MLLISALGQLNPCFRPTTVGVIDDETHFLDSINTLIESDIAFTTYSNSMNALNTFNQSNNDTRFAHQNVTDITSNKERFSNLSVLVVDYAMPELDGLTLCESINNPNIKKILLTGVANKESCDRALDNKVIDFFLRKDDEYCESKLNTKIREYQYEYFNKDFNDLSKDILKQYPFLKDQLFIYFFNEIVNKNRIYEYYFEPAMQHPDFDFLPPSFILVNFAGNVFRLSIFTDIIIHKLINYCVKHNVQQEIVTLIRDRKMLVPIYNMDGSICTDTLKWYMQMQEPLRYFGRETYYCLLTPILGYEKGTFSYFDHLMGKDGFNKISNHIRQLM